MSDETDNRSSIDALSDRLATSGVDESILSFSGKALKLNSADDAKIVIEKIQGFPKLIGLQLNGNTLGIDASKAIGQELACRPEFKRALWSDMFTGRMKSEIPPALMELSDGIMKSGAKITELDLSDNAFGPNGIDGIKTLLRSAACFSLEVLKLNNNGLGVTGGKMLADCLMDCYTYSKNDGDRFQLKVFREMGSLRELRMPQNGINSPGIVALSGALAANRHLTVLDLSDNTITGESAAPALAGALRALTRLRSLLLADCLLGTEGAKILFSTLRSNLPELRELVASGNEIGAGAVDAILAAFAAGGHSPMSRLNLNENQLGSDACARLVQALGSFLEPLDDDEGSSADEHSEDEEGADEAVRSEDDQSGEEFDDSQLVVTGRSISVSPRSAGVDDFIQHPTQQGLDALGEDPSAAVLQHFAAGQQLEVDRACWVCRQLSSLLSPTTEARLLSCCSSLLQESLKNASTAAADSPPDPSSLLANSLLSQLGLLKTEEKAQRSAPLAQRQQLASLLEELVQQPWFPPSARRIMGDFLAEVFDRKQPDISVSQLAKLLGAS